MKMKTKRWILMLTALLLVLISLAACRQSGGEQESATEEWQTADVIGIYPSETRDPDEPIVFDPIVTNPVVTEAPDGLVWLTGDVVAYVAQEPMDNVVAVEVRNWTTGKKQVYHVYVGEDVAFSEEFCVGDYVHFAYDPNAEPMESYDGAPLLRAVYFGWEDLVDEKPVIYLYPEAPTEVSVKLTLDGELTCTYPAYGDGWDNFTAYPDGTLISPNGKEYYCLYWEGKQNAVYDFSHGFCVKGEDTAVFLEWALAAQGLTPREANEFIIYWLPRMEGNPYNVISFQTTAYTDTAVLEITPTPDTLIRVFMAYIPSDVAVNIPAQEFAPVERVGFTAVEWGGSHVPMP